MDRLTENTEPECDQVSNPTAHAQQTQGTEKQIRPYHGDTVRAEGLPQGPTASGATGT